MICMYLYLGKFNKIFYKSMTFYCKDSTRLEYYGSFSKVLTKLS